MNEPTIPPDQEGTWRTRFERLRAFVRGGLPFVSGVLAALVALWLYNALTPQPAALTQREVSDSIAQAMASATPAPAFSSYVYQVIRPSLVLIETKLTNAEGEEGRGLGSGVIIDDRGDILTSLHVVSDASEIKVTFADGTESNALVIVSQPENDIAVLQADRPPELLVPAVLGNPNAMRVGDEAYVVGNPFGLYGSMSAGVISGFERTIKLPNSEQRVHGLIQIDAAVNSGNSGGPLMNRYGQVVGIITALANPTDDEVFIGIGFAVPIDVAGGAVGMPPY